MSYTKANRKKKEFETIRTAKKAFGNQNIIARRKHNRKMEVKVEETFHKVQEKMENR